MLNTREFNNISAIVMTKNEERNIGQTLEQLVKFCTKIYVIDSGSTDKTVSISESYSVEIVSHPFISYSQQFNWALDNLEIKTTWVLRIDADEYIPDDLIEEISMNLAHYKDSQEINGIILRLKVIFLGKWIRHGGIYPFRKLMIFKYGIGRIEERNMDEHTVLSSGRAIEIKKYDIVHNDFKDVSTWIAKHNWYSSREVQDYFANSCNYDTLHDNSLNRTRYIKNSVYYKLPKFHRAFAYFVYRFVFRFGFLDGRRGLIYHFLQAYWYRFLVDVKILETESTHVE